MDRSTLEAVEAAFAGLDFSAENERIEALQAEIAQTEQAIERAEARCTEIARALVQYRGPNGQDVADALLADATTLAATLAAPDAQAMDTERLALRAGIGDLRRRIESTQRTISEIEAETFGAVAKQAQPLVDALLADAREAAGKLVNIFAAFDAINVTTRHATLELAAARHSMGGLVGPMKFLNLGRRVDVPAPVQAALAPLNSKGPALPVRFISSAAIP